MAVKVTLVPAQIVVALAEIDTLAVKIGLTMILIVFVVPQVGTVEDVGKNV